MQHPSMFIEWMDCILSSHRSKWDLLPQDSSESHTYHSSDVGYHQEGCQSRKAWNLELLCILEQNYSVAILAQVAWLATGRLGTAILSRWPSSTRQRVFVRDGSP